MDENKLIAWETVEGQPVSAHGYTVTPRAQALHIRLPFGGLVWNRPVAVHVDSNTDERDIQIVDITRMAQIALFGVALLASVITLLTRK